MKINNSNIINELISDGELKEVGYSFSKEAVNYNKLRNARIDEFVGDEDGFPTTIYELVHRYWSGILGAGERMQIMRDIGTANSEEDSWDMIVNYVLQNKLREVIDTSDVILYEEYQ